MTVSRYPLAWPAGWARKYSRKSDAFKITFEKAVSSLSDEIDRLGGKYPVLSTNLEIRLDGSFKRNAGEPSDPGVAVYFSIKDKQRVFACDTYVSVRANIRAISLTIEALRSIARYGASDMMERALSAFEALPAPLDPWQVLMLPRDARREDIEGAFKRLALKHHPDVGGSTAKMAELNRARDLALEALRKT
jgi:DnaJ-like protein